MPEREQQAVRLIDRSDEITLLTHRKPDGDALGSLLGLGRVLAQQGKRVSLVCLDPVPVHYTFITGWEHIQSVLPLQTDLLILLDCGQDRLSGIDLTQLDSRINVLEIDHHRKSGAAQTPRLLLNDPSAAATTEMLFRLAQEAGWPIDRQVATCWLTGIITDTSAFQNGNTTATTMRVAAQLLRHGAQQKEIIRNAFYSSSIPKLKLWGTALSRIKPQPHAHGLVTTVLTQDDLADAGAHPDDVEGLINFLNAIPGVPAILLLTDFGTGLIKGSFRTRHTHIDVSKLAGMFGGGGHTQAAGFTVAGRLQQDPTELWRVMAAS